MIGLLTTGRHDLSYLTPIKEALGSGACSISAEPQPSTGRAVAARFATEAARRCTPLLDGLACLVVLGDRAETLAACVAATILRVPIAHIHGGDVTLEIGRASCRERVYSSV